MIPWWWSWLLAAIGVTGLFLAGSKNKLGWALGIAAQALWIAYAITSQQWGFLATAFAYGGVYSFNWWQWRKAELASRAPSAPGHDGSCTCGRTSDPSTSRDSRG